MCIEKIIGELNKVYNFKYVREEPFKLLITTVLSQRTKDEVAEEAARRLFKVAESPKELAELPVSKIAKLIYPVGFYRQKAKNIKMLSRLVAREGVPEDRNELMKLPGVGSKTAAIVLAYGFGIPAIAVDTHVNRVVQRLGLVEAGAKPERTQEVLERLTPERMKIAVNHLLVRFGKDVCKPVKPRCSACPISMDCKYYISHQRG